MRLSCVEVKEGRCSLTDQSALFVVGSGSTARDAESLADAPSLQNFVDNFC